MRAHEGACSPGKAFFSALSFAVVVASASNARAYCRATTCDPASGACKADEHGCIESGLPVFWSGPVRIEVDDAGSVLRGISGDEAQGAVSEALSTWASAVCADGHHPTLDVGTGLAKGLVAGFVPHGTNQNVVVIEDAAWPYESSAVGKTTFGLNIDTGEILDCDVELNAVDFPLAIDPATPSDVDLVAVLTHEIGHVLGLGHSDVPGATMQPESRNFATAELKTLEPDDEQGICAIYPSAKGARPSSGTPDETPIPPSGCAVSAVVPRAHGPFWVMVATLLAGRVRKRRRST